MLSLTSVMNPAPVLCDLSVRTVVKLCTLGVFALGVSLVLGLCGVCSHVIVLGMSVRLFWNPMWWVRDYDA